MKSDANHLYISKPNGKLKKLQKVIEKKCYSLDLPAGWSCPYAKDCKSKVVGTIYGLKVCDGPQTKFRCYAASLEAIYQNSFMRRWNNFKIIKKYRKDVGVLAHLISSALPKNCEVLRYNTSGDFFCKEYMEAAILTAKEHPNIIFYAYTKNIKNWLELRNNSPSNFRITASIGGKYDDLISQNNLISARVVKTLKEAKKHKLPIDQDDTHAYHNKESFALLIHGIQPKKCLINREKNK